MTYEVTTRVFEGPLDLLLQLITSRRLEITEVSLTEIVGEYLAHLEELTRLDGTAGSVGARVLDLDVTSEFLLIAATLIQLKARRLLPEDGDVDLDEELALAEERDRLLARLLACLTFKDVAAVLAHRLQHGARFVPRLAGLDDDIQPAPPDVRFPVGLEEFVAIADRTLAGGPTEPEVDHLDFDLPSVEAAITDIRHRVEADATTTFEALVDRCARKIEVVAYFLAMLELARWGVISVAQELRNGPITVRHNPSPAVHDVVVESEWSA